MKEKIKELLAEQMEYLHRDIQLLQATAEVLLEHTEQEKALEQVLEINKLNEIAMRINRIIGSINMLRYLLKGKHGGED